jgi:hypothetical protein
MGMALRCAIAFLICAVSVTAQEAPPAPAIEIRGVVLEVGTNLPVEGVEVTVDSLPKGPVAMSDLPRAAKTTTDSQGRFRIALDKLGTYLVRATKGGYI